MSKVLNLGFEALSAPIATNGSGDFSFELVDATIRCNAAEEALQELIFEGDKLMVAYDNILSIKASIVKHGVTPALEALVGDSFGGHVSMEGLGATAKKWWDAIVRWFVKAYEYVKRFFVELANRNQHWTRVLAEEIRKFDDKNVNDTKMLELKQKIVKIPAAPTAETAKAFNEAKHEPEEVTFSKTTAKAAAAASLKALNEVATMERSGKKLFEDNIRFAKAQAAAAKEADDATAIADTKKGVTEEQEKASEYTKAVSKYSKLCITNAAKMVSVLKSAPLSKNK